MARHEGFCEILASLEGCACIRRAGHKYAVGEPVIDTGHKRVFVARHNHVDGIVGHKTRYAVKIERRERYVGSVLRRAAITGGYVQIVNERALRHFPRQSRFTAT